ncbi:Disease resistance protein RPP13, partial [Mucuna pruriens]
DVHKEVDHIRAKLLINSYVKDAEEKQANVKGAKEWLNELRKVAFRMEDVIHHYLLKVAERGQRHGLFGAATKAKQKLKTLTLRHDIASEVEEIRRRIEDLFRTKEALGLTPSAGDVPAISRRLGAHFVKDSELVCIEHNKPYLTHCLTERQHPVMVVVGTGG